MDAVIQNALTVAADMAIVMVLVSPFALLLGVAAYILENIVPEEWMDKLCRKLFGVSLYDGYEDEVDEESEQR